MRVIGYIPLMYGAEYLDACIRSMNDHVEQIHIIYTSKPSQGHSTHIPCPETEDQLKEIAFNASHKIVWHNQNFGSEGEHRNYILKFAKGFDLVFTLDADEIAEEADIKQALETAYKGDKRHYGINGFINFWRSFNHVCLDGFRPYRIVNLNNTGNSLGEVNLRIYHFSTAQDIKTVRFKWNVSGHKDELRKNWVDDVYLKWTAENNFQDLHPVAFGLWNAIPFDKNTLPEILKQHPNFNKDII
jgi:hypothetical protein